MPRRPTLKLPAKPRAEKTRTGTVRPNAPRPKLAGKTPERSARPKPAPAPERERAARAAPETLSKPARPRQTESTFDRPPRPRPDEAPRKARDDDHPPRPRREFGDSPAPRGRPATTGGTTARPKRDEAWPEKRAPRTSQPARTGDDRPPRPARPTDPRTPSRANSGGDRSEARPYPDRATDETRSRRPAPRPEQGGARSSTDVRRSDDRGFGDKPHPSRPDEAPRKSRDNDRSSRPRREYGDSPAPRGRPATTGGPAARPKRDDAWADKRTPRTPQPARAADDRPPRPATGPRAPSRAASGGDRSESRYQDRAKDEPRSPWATPRPERDSARRNTDAKRSDDRGFGDKPRRPRADEPNASPRPRPASGKPAAGHGDAKAGEYRSRRPPRADARTDSSARPAVAAAGLQPRKPPSTELPRLSKRMSELGLCSRREADEWIENGWVSVDGKLVVELGTRVHPNAKITVEDAARLHQSETVTILLHKPIGYVSGQAEEGYEPAAVLIRPETRWEEDKLPIRFKRGHLSGLAPAGRLDIDSTGLLVFTQDGRIAKRLVGEDSKVEKEYLVRVEGMLDEKGLALLNHGLSLDEKALKPAHVSWQNEHQLRFVLREGKKRQIRRMCELVGLTVTGLKRIRIGSVTLSKLPVGTWRYLRPDESF